MAWVYGDDFDVDLITGVQNIGEHDPQRLLELCMQDFDHQFVSQVRRGDLVVGGRNFGYGHPHYTAMVALRAAGISAVVAESFSPGFWRGETYHGMPLVQCPGIANSATRWDELSVDWRRAEVLNLTTGTTLRGVAPNQRTIRVLEAGGRLPLLLAELGRAATDQ